MPHVVQCFWRNFLSGLRSALSKKAGDIVLGKLTEGSDIRRYFERRFRIDKHSIVACDKKISGVGSPDERD
jgi:hypothetical protein